MAEVEENDSSATASEIDEVGFLVPDKQGTVVILELVDPADSRAVRNKNMILDHYARMINGKDAETGTRHFDPGYIQHNPLMADGQVPLAAFFSEVSRGRETSRIVVHKIISVGNFVWTHVNFLNFFSDDPDDTGVAGVDIFKMDDDGRAIEHWDVLQFVGDPTNSAPMLGANIPRANSNGMFEERT